MKQKNIYLREVTPGKQRYGGAPTLSIFSGDIKEDRIYWKKYFNSTTRYFILVEVK